MSVDPEALGESIGKTEEAFAFICADMAHALWLAWEDDYLEIARDPLGWQERRQQRMYKRWRRRVRMARKRRRGWA